MNCKNCGTALTSENNFCNSCGAKVIHNQLTLKNVFEDFSEQFLNYDNKFLQTFIALIKNLRTFSMVTLRELEKNMSTS
jgi:predicted amidophosphoribosyltransferase